MAVMSHDLLSKAVLSLGFGIQGSLIQRQNRLEVQAEISSGVLKKCMN